MLPCHLSMSRTQTASCLPQRNLERSFGEDGVEPGVPEQQTEHQSTSSRSPAKASSSFGLFLRRS